MESKSMEKAPTDYERYREERIKANMKTMRNLGILHLSRDVKAAFRTPCSSTNHEKEKKPDLSPRWPLRRSRRLQNLGPVVCTGTSRRKSRDVAEAAIVLDKEDMGDEFYTEEHEKLLGSCELPWTLFVDGYNKDGTLIYDVNGKTCHQCRLKTVGYRTSCCKCQLLQGQFCGDCLYMRYGENILEAIKNPDWICPVCRDICNCGFCRLKKGWYPTGPLYKMVVEHGYKSVAHYLIQTCRKPGNSGETPPSKYVAAMCKLENSGETLSSKDAHAMSDDTEAVKENYPKLVMPERSDDNIIVVSSDESTATDDGENMARSCPGPRFQ